MRYSIIFLAFFLAGCKSCQVGGSNENLTLPDMVFPIQIFPDSAYIKLGDTVTIYTGIPNPHDTVLVEDGKGIVDFYFAFSDSTPITEFKLTPLINENHVDIVNIDGILRLWEASGRLLDVAVAIRTDSILAHIKLIPLKSGTYSLSLQSSFFEGSQGKARTYAYFDVEDNHGEELWVVPDMPALTPDSPNYRKLYYFAVYE